MPWIEGGRVEVFDDGGVTVYAPNAPDCNGLGRLSFVIDQGSVVQESVYAECPGFVEVKPLTATILAEDFRADLERLVNDL